MALLDPYATLEQFRERARDNDQSIDGVTEESLVVASRLTDRSLMVHDGAFNAVTAATYTFDARGRDTLWLRDQAGYAYFLNALTSVGVDTERDGTYDGITLLAANAWVRGLPENATALSQPFTHLGLLPHIAGATLTRWPVQPAGVQVTGDWGWSAVPGAIVDFTCHMARDLEAAQMAGAIGEVLSIDGSGLPLRDQTWRTWALIKSTYGRAIPVVY